MIKKILFYILTILAVWACCLCTLRFARAEEQTAESWAAMGNAIQYCSGVGFHYSLFTKWEAAGATLIMTTPDGTSIPYFEPMYQYTCDVLFMSQPTVDGTFYLIGIDWKFMTPESVSAWEELVEEANAFFCKHSKATHINGFTKITYPMGFVKIVDCEETEEI